MAFRYSIVLETLAMGGQDVFGDIPALLGKLRDGGFDALDLPDHKSKILDAREIHRIARSQGLTTPAIVGAWGYWHGGEERDLCSEDPAVRKRGIAYGKECVDLAEELDAPVLEICAAPKVAEYPVSSISVPTLRKHFVDSTRELCLYAGEHGVNILIEPINRFEGYAGFMNNFDDALSVIEEIDLPELGILGDFFHMAMECVSIPEAIREAGERLRHVHLADHSRLIPGCGNIDFKAVLRTLTAIGFDGYLSLDCVPAKPDVDTFLARSLSYMKAVEEVIGLQEMIYAMDRP